MGARLINNNGQIITKLKSGQDDVKIKYEQINGKFEPVYYDGYVLYNSLKSDGNAYIDLGHKGDSTHKYEIDFEYKLESVDDPIYRYFFGSRSAYRENEIAITKGATSRVWSAMQYSPSNGAGKLSTLLSTNSRYKISISRSKIEVNINGSVSTQANTLTTDFTTPYNLVAFAMNENGSQNISNSAFHSIKEYDSTGKLLYHYVPARRQSDNQLGMLDVINGVFYTNANSVGTFMVFGDYLEVGGETSGRGYTTSPAISINNLAANLTKCVYAANMYNTSATWSKFFDIRTSDGTIQIVFNSRKSKNQTSFNTYFGNGVTYRSNSFNVKHMFIANYGSVIVDGVTYPVSIPASPPVMSRLYFCREGFFGQLYALQILDNSNNVLYNFIPAMNNQYSGFYDTVSNTFYPETSGNAKLN